MEHNRTGRKIVAIVVMLCISVLFDLVTWYCSREAVTFIQEGQREILTEAATTDNTQDKEINEGFRINLAQTGSVVLSFTKPLSENTIILFSMNRPGDEPWWYQLKYEASRGLTEYGLNLPEDCWAAIRFETEPRTEISGAVASEGKATEARKPYPVRIVRVLCGFIIELAVFFLIENSRKQNDLALFERQIREKVLDPDSRRREINIFYILFSCIMMMSHFYALAFSLSGNELTDQFAIAWIIFAIAGILFGRMWKEKAFWFLACFLLLMQIRMSSTNYTVANQYHYAVLWGVYAFAGCFSIGFALNQKERKRFIRIFCAAWTIAMAALSALSLYAAWTGNPVRMPGEGFIQIFEGRLWPLMHPVLAGTLFSVSIAVGAAGLAATRKRAGKILYGAGILMIFIAGILTSTRTNYVITAVEISIIICIPLHDKLFSSGKKSRGASFAKYTIVLTALAALSIAFAVVQPLLINVFNETREKRGFVCTQAKAEETEAGTPEEIPDEQGTPGEQEATAEGERIAQRDFSSEETMSLNSRVLTWESMFEVLRNNPRILIWGNSLGFSMDEINMIRISKGSYPVSHCHNMLFQILYESGIPGLILYIGFLVCLVYHSVRLIKNRKIPFWQRLISLPVFGCLIGDVADIMTHIRGGCPQLTILFVFAGFTIAISKASENNT